MSLILEALKKIDKDKSRTLQKKNIAAAVLHSGSGTKRGKVLLISCILFSAAALLAAGAGMNYLFSEKGQPAAPAPAAVPDAPAKAAEPAPVKPAQSESAPPVPVMAKPLAAGKPPASQAARRKAEKKQEAGSAPVTASGKVPGKTSNKASGETSAGKFARGDIPPISIGGIIWAEEIERRRALVNGSTVREGDTVDGVRVERIESSRIRFSKNGKSFEVPVGSGL
ncbi:MAG: general secretion pathway protein GspB [Syntrophales bacterium]|nr:general secretion pathway protein GspB [Syntrophales bacterium]MDD5532753.1 general secretion pathway protein GspB [Syntrophales bacterium]